MTVLKSTWWALILAISAICVLATGARADILTWGSSGTGNGQFQNPWGVAVAPGGSVYVTDPGNHRVQHFTSSGTYLGKWGSFGSGPGQFSNDLNGVAVSPTGKVYTSDVAGGNGPYYRVQRFDANGNFETGWASGNAGSGSDLGQLDRPRDITVGPSGQVYVADQGNRRVQRFNADGGSPIAWGSLGTGNGQFTELWGVAAAGNGDVYTMEQSPSPRIQRFTSSGSFLGKWGQISSPSGIAVAPNGDVYTQEQGNTRIQRFDRNGTFLASYDWAPGGAPGQFTTPIGLAATDRYLYAADTGNNRIQRIDLMTPTAALQGPDQVLTGQSVTLDARSSNVPLGRITNYRWDLDGNGSFETDTGAVPTATHTYGSRGPVDVGLRVRSEKGGIDTVRHRLDVFLASPPGPVGVSINDGAQYTNDPNVDIALRWPSFASQVVISNDGGFTPFSQLPVDAAIPWQLDSSGPERLPKTIYTRFLGGESGPETYQDDIILDETAPKLKKVRAHKRQKSLKLKIKAKDKTSGVKKMQVTKKKKKPGKWKKFKKKAKLRTSGSKAFVRVRDAAENRSKWRRAKTGG